MRQLSNELIINTPFDQFSRQFQVAEILARLRGKQPLKILDVGGHKGETARFLADDDVTIIDLYDVEYKNYVKGSALDMPFADNEFDYVLSFDVLEHIAPGDRETFFKECARVAGRGVIICAPHKTPANESAERALNDLYKKLHHKPHQWLQEHIDNGIPDFSKIEQLASKQALATAKFYSNKTQLWVSMQQAIFLNSKYSMAAERLLELNEYYNRNFMYDGGGTEESSYRLILCCLYDKKLVTKLESELGKLNQPIDAEREIELLNRIAEFQYTLVQKMSVETKNYKRLHSHELQRATKLQENGEELWHRVNDLEGKLLSRKGRGLAKSVVSKIKSRTPHV